jgi:hypothetical protein
MKTNMIVQAWRKDHVVDLGMAGGFHLQGFEKFTGKKQSRIWPCVYVLNTAAVENTVEVHHQPT